MDRASAPAGPWALLLAAASLAAFGLVHGLSAVTVDLVVDGRTAQVRTRAGTVEDLLAEHHVPVRPGDLVSPPPAARIGPGTTVVVDRARPVRVLADGRARDLHSHGRTARALLVEAGVHLGPRDVVTLDGRPWQVEAALPSPTEPAAAAPASRAPGDPMRQGLVRPASAAEAPTPPAPAPTVPDDGRLRLRVWRASRVTVIEDGLPFELDLAGPTVGDALAAAGIPLYPEDRLWPAADAAVSPGLRVRIERATPFLVQADGRVTPLRAVAATVGEALAVSGIGLAGRDYAIPAADAPLTPDLTIQVVRVAEDFQVLEKEIAYDTATQPDPELDLDQTRVLRPGVPGLRTQRIRILYENGEETSREVVEDTVVREPVSEILAYGTRITWGTVDTPEGPKRYWRRLRVYATSYSLSRSGTSPSAPWYGRTRTGLPMRRGIVAVDPRVIALWTNVYVPGYGVGLAGDTGGGVRGLHVDLGYGDDDYESWHQYTEIYLLEPLPPDDRIRWVLP